MEYIRVIKDAVFLVVCSVKNVNPFTEFCPTDPHVNRFHGLLVSMLKHSDVKDD